MLGASGMGVGRVEVDARTPNQKRLDEIIEQNEEIIEELKKFNKNLVIVGEALIKINEKPIRKVVDKAR